jgi:hypothetical protein
LAQKHVSVFETPAAPICFPHVNFHIPNTTSFWMVSFPTCLRYSDQLTAAL